MDDYLGKAIFPESLQSPVKTSVEIGKIVVQPTKLKSLDGEIQSLEVIHFKRAIFDFIVNGDDGKESAFQGVLYFPSRILAVTRKEGRFSTELVIEFLVSAYITKYDADGLSTVRVRENGRIWDCVVENPNRFIGFVHHLRESGTLGFLRETIE